MNKTKGLENLVDVFCPLDEAFAQLAPESIQLAHEIQQDRIDDESLRSGWLLTSNGCVYNVENGEAVLYFTNTKFNPVLKQENIADAVVPIMQSKNYKVNANDFSLIQREAAKKNGGAKRYVLSDLKLIRFDDGWSFFEINTEKYDKLNKTQRAFAEQVHGKGKQFVKVMQEMRKAGINTTNIYVLNPEYVKSVAGGNPVACAGRLCGFDNHGYFLASGTDIGSYRSRVRGVRRETVGGSDVTKIQTPCPEEILAASRDYIPTVVQKEFEEKIRALYKQ